MRYVELTVLMDKVAETEELFNEYKAICHKLQIPLNPNAELFLKARRDALKEVMKLAKKKA